VEFYEKCTADRKDNTENCIKISSNMKLSIKYKILLAFIATLIVTSAINLFLISQILKKDYSAALQSELLILGNSLQTQLQRITSLGISTRDIEGFSQQCFELVRKNEYITRAMIIDRDGTIIFHSDPSYEGKKFLVKDVLSAIKTGNSGIYSITENGDKMYSAVVPFGDNLDHSKYAVVVCSPAGIINGKIIKLINRSNAVLFSTFGLGAILLLVILTTMLTNPLAVILNAMKDITKTRDLRKRVNIKTDDEISEIADAFNTMTADLQNTTISVDSLNIQITERKKVERALKESQQMLRLVMDNIPQYVFWKDKNSVYLGCNAIFAKAAGLNKPEDIIGKTDFDLAWKKEESDFYRECDRKVMESGKPQYHIIEPQQQSDGRQAWLDTNKVPLHDADGNLIGIIGAFEDITERKQAEEQLQKLNNDLADAVGKLEDANQEMKNFLYIASHDLREPLHRIAVFGDMLSKSLQGKLTEEDTENLQYMIEGTQRINRVIEGLLAYAKVNAKTLPPEVVNLNDIVKQLQELEFSILLQEKLAIVEVPATLPYILVDPIQIRQLMQNLIANGIKYQPRGNTPCITITSKHAANGMERIEVKDNGIGIKPEYHQAVFNMFKRLHARVEYEGIGVGLAICKKIVERYGGQIGVDSEYGKGSTFWFTVPRADKLAVKEVKTKI
jgi:PAS domain S-box-containing protein